MSFFSGLMDVVGKVGKVVANAVTLNAFSSLSKSGSSSANVTNSTNMANSTLTGSNFGDSILEHAIGSGIDFGYNYLAAQLSNETAQANAKYWANYNSPVNQMQRLKEAGLNPNMVYGNGSATSTYEGNADAPQIHGVNTRMLYSAELANLRADIQNKKSNSANLDAQTNVHNKEAEYYAEMTKGQQLDNARKSAADPETMGEYDLKAQIQNFKNLSQEYRESVSREDLNMANWQVAKVQKELFAFQDQVNRHYGVEKVIAELTTAQAEAAIMKINADYAKPLKQMELRIGKATASELVSRTVVNYALKELYASEKAQYDELVTLTKNQAKLTGAQANTEEQKLINMKQENKLMKKKGLLMDLERRIQENEAWISDKTAGARVYQMNVDGYVTSTFRAISSGANAVSDVTSAASGVGALTAPVRKIGFR